MSEGKDKLILAIPKGRILEEVMPILNDAGLAPKESDRAPETKRQIMVQSQDPNVRLIIVRSSDVQTYVSYGTAQLGMVGRDFLLESPLDGLLQDCDLHVGKCRLSLAAPHGFDLKKFTANGGQLTAATKYPRLAREFFLSKGIQAEIVRLHGTMELAPNSGLADVIVDLVSTGMTLKANDLTEITKIKDISTHLVINQNVAWRNEPEIKSIASRLVASAKKLQS